MEKNKKLLVKNASVIKELVSYKDKTSGDVKEFYLWKIVINGRSLKVIPNKDQLEYLENDGYEVEEID